MPVSAVREGENQGRGAKDGHNMAISHGARRVCAAFSACVPAQRGTADLPALSPPLPKPGSSPGLLSARPSMTTSKVRCAESPNPIT